MPAKPGKYQLKVRILDSVMDEEIGDSLPHERLGCFVQYQDRFLDAIMIHDGGQPVKPDSITFTLDEGAAGTDPRVVLICKDIASDQPFAGSVSIARSILLEGNLDQTYNMWVTLFDDPTDDEYDGALGVQDDEEPRVRFEFTVSQVPAPKPVEPTVAQPAKKTEAKAEKSYMQPIGNVRGRDRTERDPAPGEKSVDRSALSTAAPRTNQAARTSAKTAAAAAAKKAAAPKKDLNTSTASRQLTSFNAEGPSQMSKVVELQKILDQNNDKRQNVKFLRALLDQQLDLLVNNLKYMQNNNSEIELETIKRLQVVEQFGEDAKNGLIQANAQNVQIKQDIDE